MIHLLLQLGEQLHYTLNRTQPAHAPHFAGKEAEPGEHGGACSDKRIKHTHSGSWTDFKRWRWVRTSWLPANGRDRRGVWSVER
jgi:hypothetical protein